MEIFNIKNLSFTYPKREACALDKLTFSVERGEFVTLCGKSGCGKTTLLRLLKTALAPHGSVTGEILFQGRPLSELCQQQQSEKIGFVMQSPDNQLVCDKVWHELAFGLESLGLKTSEIRVRVAEMASFFGIEAWFHQDVNTLSGGQKQLLNLASVMAMQPSVLILDEPTSQLDPISASDFLGTLSKINRELGTTIILAEHRLEEALPLSTRLLVLDSGALIADGSPREVAANLLGSKNSMFAAMPTPVRVFAAVENQLPCPLTVSDGRLWLEEFSEARTLSPELIPLPCGNIPNPPIVELKNLWFRYEHDSPDILKGLSVCIHQGEIFALMGGNGTGKTTTLSVISGILKSQRGTILIDNQPASRASDRGKLQPSLAVLPQNPQALFVEKTLIADLYEMLDHRGLSSAEQQARVEEVSLLCELKPLLSCHPYDLSLGEQQRAALAKVLLTRPQILLLDEPTKGLDAHFKEKLAAIFHHLLQQGVTIIMATHDIEFCAKNASRCAMFFDGDIVSVGEPREFFSGKSFYTTSASRMARGLLPTAVLAEDIILACGGNPLPPVDVPPLTTPTSRPATSDIAPTQVTQKIQKPPLSRRTLISILISLLIIPLTVYVGTVFFDDKNFYIISLIIIIETMIPMALAFNGRQLHARELIIIAVLCAIGVTGRAAFFFVPQVKPLMAVVIISGVCFGGETGFFVGAISAFVSNFMFGQGPWTPWQMFAFGLVGLLAGVLFKVGRLPQNRLLLCGFGGLATVIIFGVIMDISAALMYPTFSPALLLTVLGLGLPFNLIHGGATVVFLLLAGKPMIEKLERIKTKYGIIQP